MRDKYELGYCSHPAASPASCDKIVKAHTVQKRGGLGAIAEGGHVLTFKPSMKGMIEHQGKPSPREIGIRNASVFPGFCSKHDSGLFKAVEGVDITLNLPSAFLLSYRAIAYETFRKDVQLRSISILREADKGQPFWKQVLIQRHLYMYECGVRRGLQDVRRWKADFDDRLLSDRYDDFHFYSVCFDSLLPIVGCGAFHAEVDFRGNLLQRLSRGQFDFDHVALNVTAYRDQTVMVLGWIGSDTGPAASLARSFRDLSDNRKADAAVRFAFEHSDNVFIRKSWWGALPSNDQERLLDQARSGTTMKERRNDCLVDHGSHYAVGHATDTAAG